MADIISLLRNSPTLKNCPEQYFPDLAKGTEYLNFLEGQDIIQIGVVATSTFLICFGSVKLIKPASHGKDTILRFLRPGDFVGAGILAPSTSLYPIAAIAHEDCGIIKIPKKLYLDAWMSKPEIALILHQHLMARILEFQTEKAEAIFSVPKKIAFFLIRTLDQQPHHYGNRISIPLTRKDIADRVGTSVETVIRVLSEWSKNNSISTNERHIEILNRKFFIDMLNRD